MFEKYKALENKMLQIMDNDGNIINKEDFPQIEPEKITEAYEKMLFERTADTMTVGYQRQGRIFTYPPNYGQEAIHIAVADTMDKEDWVVPAFRELGIYLAKGATLKEIFLYFMGYEEGTAFRNALKLLPISVPIASQLPHATGLGYAIKYKKLKEIVWAFVGDGGTSEGDFHEALNFAGVWQVPVIFIVQNNQYAISTSVENQTNSVNYAVKSLAYGIEGLKVDGNDYFAMYKALDFCSKYARENSKPVLIEALTYRKGAHTTSDDPKKYRTKEEEEKWECTDPLKRLKAYLIKNNLFSEQQEEKLIEQYKNNIDKVFSEAENYEKYKLEDVFKHHYNEIPDDLKQQMNEYEIFLKWKQENFKEVKTTH